MAHRPGPVSPAAHLVCLTFDFDSFSSRSFYGLTGPVQLSQAEFSAVGAVRILDLLRDRGIATTWFVPGHTVDTYPEIVRRVHAEGHEIAHHGYLHEVPARSSKAEEQAALTRGSDRIRRITGEDPRGYRAPGWDFSEHTIELLVGQGFAYDSSLMGADFHPYFVRRGDVAERDGPYRFGEPTAILELPVHWSLDDVPHFEYQRRETVIQQGLMRTDDVLANWLDDFRYMRGATDRGVLTYTMHPEVTGRGHRMLMLTKLIDELSGLGARFVRADAAARTAREWLAGRT
ncbi:MAG: polysaccharide deacetylase [Chloroflexota bacterium]|nr:polysaccharide deacetylase [Chloroflexota bacterium]